MNNLYRYEDFNRINEEYIDNLSAEEKALAEKGELSSYLREHGKVFTFGILKRIFRDALEYKKKRELKKGTMRFFHGMIPMIGGMFMLPISLVGMALGSSRALNNVLTPVLRDPNKTYNSFLHKFITEVFDFSEGYTYRKLLGDDWFWKIFVMKDDLIRMLRKEHVVVFTKYLADKMEEEPDEKEVPHNYIENELKMWMNEEFKIDPPLQLKDSRE